MPKTLVRKNIGGEDINYVLHYLLNRKNNLHYFPSKLLLK